MNPKPAREPRTTLNPVRVDNAMYVIERSVTTSVLSGARKGKKTRKTSKEWRHGKCPVKHRSEAAAARCRNP
ncbi:MAG TPA: hypothetical protein VNF47_17250 [Streptosporangiaceae bacterium]|nr:hypothetical protein [Streptosporangiaceae bacterium]